ncbi:hypothetical protein H0H87_001161 [Tephrocybe sp. NHM501043]|nr:hypothetical protein H0H87_001161 [Tephrocybe sp. NHM501043]
MTLIALWLSTAAIIFVMFLVIVTIVYRLFFHRLRDFPGPRLAAITPLYKIYYEVFRGGELLQHLIQLHAVYGNVVRIAPNELHFNEYAAHSAIYATGSHFTKDRAFYHSFGADESAFGAIQPQDSKLRRNMLAPLFSRRAILNIEHNIQDKVERLISRLATNHQEKPADMMLAFRCATMDIIASHCFPSSESSLNAPDFHDPFIVATREAIPSIWLMKFCPGLTTLFHHLPSWLTRRLPSSSILAFTRLSKMISEDVDRMLVDNNFVEALDDGLTIYGHLLHTSKQELKRSRRSLVEEMFSLLQAGTESPGNACAVGTYHVLSDPQVHARLFEELSHAWPDSDAPVEYSVLEKLPYLTAVIKESLRLSHGIVTPLPRIVGPMKTMISGHAVPPGVNAFCAICFLVFSFLLYEKPQQFLPDRWMKPNSKELDQYLLPFSKGPRMCMGVK